MGRDFKENSVNNINKKKFDKGYDRIFRKKDPETMCDKCHYNLGEQCTNESMMRDGRVVNCKINHNPIVACSYFYPKVKKNRVECKMCNNTMRLELAPKDGDPMGMRRYKDCYCIQERLNDHC